MSDVGKQNSSEAEHKIKNTMRLDVSIYGRESVINIGKDVLRVLGAPVSVCFKVNHGMDSFVVMPCDEKEALSFRVPDDIMFNGSRQMRVTSRSFVTGLLAVNGLEASHTYKISGTYSEKNNAVIFNMSDIRRYRK